MSVVRPLSSVVVRQALTEAEAPLNIEKLKKRAHRFEDKGQTAQAIEVYQQILDGLDGTPEMVAELSLFNKLGDLFLKERKVSEAVDMYERAVDLYSEHGFPNNAIALCNKILRNAPSRTSIYLKLAELMLERGFVAEAKQNLLEYADRMQKAGRTDEAFKALKEFADLSPENEEIRLLLAGQLKAAARDVEAREQLGKLYAEAEESGDERRTRDTLRNIKTIDPEFDVAQAPKAKVPKKKEKSSELIFLDLDEEFRADELARAGTAVGPKPRSAEPVIEEPEVEEPEVEEPEVEEPEVDLEILRTSTELDEDAAAGVDQVEGLVIDRGYETGSLDIEPTALDEPEAEPVEELDLTDVEAELEPEAEAEPAGVVDRSFGELEIERPVELDVPEEEDEDDEEDEEAPTDELPLIEFAYEDDSTFTLSADDVDTELDVPDLDLGAALETENEADESAAMRLDMASELVDEEAEASEPPEPAALEAEEAEEEEEPPPAPPTVEELQRAVADDPDDAALHVSLGEALVERGDRDRGIEELAIAVTMYEGEEDYARAASLTDEILRLDPNSVRFHQKRVEQAYRSGNRALLSTAYLGLGDALLRDGAVERAQAVYRRVLEHDPDNVAARQALDTFGPTEEEQAAAKAAAPAAPAAAPDDAAFVDLSALIFGDEPVVRNTRMRIQEEEPTGDEERDFADMLSQFKRGIEQNIDEEDWQAHYDLGIAFKEMGLVDEAIAELQKALRDPTGRLRTAEALGRCFIEKEQYSVAATVMKRAVESDSRGDELKIGLLYWIGRCEEAQHRLIEALNWYQRVFALDIKFEDVSGRVKQLAKAAK